jgi:hypothetical protein
MGDEKTDEEVAALVAEIVPGGAGTALITALITTAITTALIATALITALTTTLTTTVLITALIITAPITTAGEVKFPEFMAYMMMVAQDQGTPDQIIEAFTVLTSNAPFITEAQMAAVMSEDEVAYLVANMPEVEGGYDYKAWTGDAFN